MVSDDMVATVVDSLSKIIPNAAVCFSISEIGATCVNKLLRLQARTS